jgi:hypothetical protein
METEDGRAVLRDALIREGVALLVMAGLLWYLGPGKIWAAGIAHRVRQFRKGRTARIDAEVARFGREVSTWEHEQAKAQDRGAGGGSPCGCG